MWVPTTRLIFSGSLDTFLPVPRPVRARRGMHITHPDDAHAQPRPLVLAAKMKLTDEVFRSFRVSKVFRENTDRVNCLDFSANGDQMIASSNDDSIVIYCCLEGRWALFRIARRYYPYLYECRPKRTLYSKKYGCDLLQYTHAPNAIVYSSNKVDGKRKMIIRTFSNDFVTADTIRYLSLHDNKFLRYFPGHTKR